MNFRFICVSAAVLAAASCLRPTEERVERDREVGQAEQAGLSVNVDEGLSAVRSLSDDGLVLWGSAPAFRLTLSSAQPRTLELEVQNSLPDAELRVLSGAAQVTSLGAADAPTRLRFRLELPAGETRLAFAAP